VEVKFTLCTKMEILDINLTKDSILLFRAIHSPFYWQILKKTLLFSYPYKKIREIRKLESLCIAFCRTKKLV
jgi:hypothetical protein